MVRAVVYTVISGVISDIRYRSVSWSSVKASFMSNIDIDGKLTVSNSNVSGIRNGRGTVIVIIRDV